jgi:PKD repeat protein
VILPPAGTPKSSFVVTPAPPLSVSVGANFDASASCPATDSSGNCLVPPVGSIVSYVWTFGDGSGGSGVTTAHTFSAPGTFTVTLTVTNDRAVSGTSSQAVNVTLPQGPTADFVFSPTSPVISDLIQFNADISKSAPGHSIVQINWNFGDGTTASGLFVSHKYTQAGTYSVTLSIADDAGQKATKNTAITVGTGNPTAVMTLNKTGGNSVQADGSASSSVGSSKITTYTFVWGDGSANTTGSAASAPHTYTVAGTYTVRLTVTDDQSRTGTTTTSVTVP